MPKNLRDVTVMKSAHLTAIRKAFKAYVSGGDVDPILSEAGLAPADKQLSHDDAVRWLLKERAAADKAQIVQQFLQGVESNQAHLRAGLSALACATHFPDHRFTVTNQFNCQVCGAFDSLDVDFVALNRVRYLCGVVLGGDIEDIAHCLQQAASLPSPPPEALRITLRIFAMLRQLPADAKPNDALKQLRKVEGVKMDEEEARSFIELLGHCGILRTPEHPGLWQCFTNLGLAPSSSRSSYWSYPVDFWRGEHGICADAMAYWFGDYPELSLT